ncbi:unnamed protein product [Effrenium voratum]|nr:unnamed protein product [Effrenium voratum]
MRHEKAPSKARHLPELETGGIRGRWGEKPCSRGRVLCAAGARTRPSWCCGVRPELLAALWAHCASELEPLLCKGCLAAPLTTLKRPQVLAKLAFETLRTLTIAGPAPVICALLKVLLKMDPKTATELYNLGLPELVLATLDQHGGDVAIRRLAAEAVVKTVEFGFCQSKPVQPALCTGPSTGFHFKEPQLPSAEAVWQAEPPSPQPLCDPDACAQALKRRLETWKMRATSPRSPVSMEEAPLVLDADFESGSLGPVTRIGPFEYEVQLLSDASGGSIQWFCFRVRQMRPGQLYTFHLMNFIKPGSLFEEGCQPVFFSKRRMEATGIAWSREGIDTAYYPCGFAGTRKLFCISFDMCFPFEEDDCFFAYSVPYTYSDLRSDLSRFPQESLAVTTGGQQVPALRMGSQGPRACIVARAHPCETHASWVMRGVLDFLLGNDPEAQSCLSQVAWLLVPMLNPDGVAAGRTRTNLDSVDLNRHHHDDTAAETKALKSALQAEGEAGELLAFVDIHSHSKRRGIFAIANGNSADRLVSLIADRTPFLDLPGTSRTEARPKDVGVGRMAAAFQGYKFSLTIESSLGARHTADEHLLLQDLASAGKAICLAIVDLLCPEANPARTISAATVGTVASASSMASVTSVSASPLALGPRSEIEAEALSARTA